MSHRTGFHDGRLGIGLEIDGGGDGSGKPRYPLDINGDIRLSGAIVDSSGNPIQMMAQQRTFPNAITTVEREDIGDGTVFGAGTFKLNGLKTYYNEGNVGIGTDDPTDLFTVSSSSNSALLIEKDSNTFSKIYNNGEIWLKGGTTSDQILLRTNGNNSYFLNTNVGIGITDPGSFKLNVAGNTNISGDLNCDSFSSLVGMVCYFASVSPPGGWITCSGQFLNKSTYNKLYAVIGNVYGEQGNTFRLPDLRGNFIRCLNTSSSGEDIGRSLSTIQADSTKSPNSSFTTSTAGSHNHTITVHNGGSHNHTGSTGTAGNHNHTGSTGSGGAHRHGQRHWYNYSGSAYLGWHDARIWSGAFLQADWGLTLHTTSNANEGGPAIGHHTHSCTIGNNGDHTHSVTINDAAAHSHTASSDTTGSHTHTISGGDIETRPKNFALLACIKY